MTLLQKIRTSFSTQLWLWVAGHVVVTSSLVLFLLASFSREVIHDETTDTTLQALENIVLRTDNTLRQQEMTARLEGKQFSVDREHIERLLEENGSEKRLREALPDAELFVMRRDSSELGSYISGEEGGYRQVVKDDKEMYLFTHPIGNRHYNLAAICPAENIYIKFSRMYKVLLFWGVGGVLLLLYILYVVIGLHLRPLHRLADAAQSIADGNLDTAIPDSHHEHESGRLQSSLKTMQQSLRAYMNEMQQKQATLSEQNAELQAAYGQAQAYEKKKAKFLHDMTDRMAAPVEKVCHCTNTICQNTGSLSKTDMSSLEADIMTGTEEITELLDQLIKEPADA